MARGGRRVGAGRKLGSPNKLTGLARDAIASAADRLGGADRLVVWARADPQNERAFWSQIYTKLLGVQMQISGPEGGPVQVRQIVNEFVSPRPNVVSTQ